MFGNVSKNLSFYVIFRWSIIVLICGFATISTLQGSRNAIDHSVDLQWLEGSLIARGINPYDVYLNDRSSMPLGADSDKLGPVQIPSVLVFFSPLSVFDFSHAKTVWLVLNLVSTVLLSHLICRVFHLQYRLFFPLIVILLISSTPWRMTIGNGQHGVISLSLFFTAYFFFLNERFWTSYLFSVIATLKYTITFPLFLLFFAKPRQALSIGVLMILTHLMITIFCGIALKESPISLFMQSLNVASSLKSEGWFDVFAMLSKLDIESDYIYLISILLFAIGFYASLRFNQDQAAAVLSLLSLLLVYHRPYDYFVIILCIPFIVKNINLIKDRKANVIEVIVIVVFFLEILYIFYISRLMDFVTSLLPELMEPLRAFDLFVGVGLYILTFSVVVASEIDTKRRKVNL
jgi:hypothetical protein